MFYRQLVNDGGWWRTSLLVLCCLPFPEGLAGVFLREKSGLESQDFGACFFPLMYSRSILPMCTFLILSGFVLWMMASGFLSICRIMHSKAACFSFRFSMNVTLPWKWTEGNRWSHSPCH